MSVRDDTWNLEDLAALLLCREYDCSDELEVWMGRLSLSGVFWLEKLLGWI